jgi:UDP-3-O-[3-hydroxymyristoyl] N-acetylglucosamine deacetylase
VSEMNQCTIADKIEFIGIGLHSGSKVRMEILPAPASSGIVFERIDYPLKRRIDAKIENVQGTKLSTTLSNGECYVSTVEHVMAALNGMGVDNAWIRVNGPEIPIMDGSAAEFVSEIIRVGIVKQGAKRNCQWISQAFEVTDGDRYIRARPSRELKLRCSIDFPGSIIGKQTVEWKLSRENFENLAQARTFCHLSEVEAMRKRGLALGGSLQNAVVVSDERILNEEGLRSKLEFAEHKLLDFIGDVALAGFPVLGDLEIHKPGHDLNAKFVRTLIQNQNKLLSSTPLPQHSEIPVGERAAILVYAI